MATHLQNTPVSNHRVQAQILYHWLSFVNEFLLVQASGANWNTTTLSGSTGVINSSTPQAFYEASPVFSVGDVGKHIAVRDATNPSNCHIAEITAFVSPTRVTLDSTTVFNVSATDIEYIIFDTASPPSTGDFFVLQTPSTVGPAWQFRCDVSAAPAALSFQLGFLGGWDVGLGSWALPASTVCWFPTSVSRLFCTSDSASGYFLVWNEAAPGGLAASRNAVWIGALSPFHSPLEAGVPKDLGYSAIFGSTSSPGPANNLNRDTSVANSFVIGEALDDSNTVVPCYIAQKRTLAAGTDVLAIAAAAINPRSGQIDDYDAIAFMRSPDQAWRGRVLGVRILNDAVANRTPINSNNSYVLGNGIGSSWNGKAPLP